MGSEPTVSGVSYGDVSAYLKHLTSTYGGYFSYTLAHDVSREKTLRLSIVLERRDSVVHAQCVNHPVRKWGYFPNNNNATFAGTLLRLCFELDEQLAKRETVAQRELPF